MKTTMKSSGLFLSRVVVLLLPAIPSSAALITVKDPPYNAVGNGIADDTAAINAALADRLALIPCGTYKITATLVQPSNSAMIGMGDCSVIKPASSLPSYGPPNGPFPAQVYIALTNSDYVNGNSGLTVKNVKFDATNKNVGDMHNLHFRNVSDVLVDGITTYKGGDGVAFTKATNFKVVGSTFRRATNAGMDTWESSSDGLFANSTVDGEGLAYYGVLATSVATIDAGSAYTTRRIKIEALSIRGVVGIGIQFQGGSANSRTMDSTAIGNTIADGTVQGIRASEADGILIEGNTISGSQNSIVSAGESVLPGINGIIRGNIIRNNGSNPAIWIGYLSTGWTVGGNIAFGANKTIHLDAGTSGNVISNDNLMTVTNNGGPANVVCIAP